MSGHCLVIDEACQVIVWSWVGHGLVNEGEATLDRGLGRTALKGRCWARYFRAAEAVWAYAGRCWGLNLSFKWGWLGQPL
ncbi:MAG: hypothetical protein ACPGWR_17890 [Ardenticatenaceae bacterium]